MVTCFIGKAGALGCRLGLMYVFVPSIRSVCFYFVDKDDDDADHKLVETAIEVKSATFAFSKTRGLILDICNGRLVPKQ